MLKILLALSLVVGALPFPTLAATVDPYIRTPSGSPIEEGIVNFDYSITDFAVGTTYYRFLVNAEHYPYQFSSGCTSIGVGTVTESFEFPATPDEYSNVRVNEYTDSGCTLTNGSTNMDDSFTVMGEVATSTATTTDAMTRMDSLFLWGIAIFLLAYPVWGRIFRL